MATFKSDQLYFIQDDNSGATTPSSTNSRTPIAGHVSSVRASEQEEKKITTTVKDAASKHIDPRTGLVQQGPSEMRGINGQINNNNSTEQLTKTPSPPPQQNGQNYQNKNGGAEINQQIATSSSSRQSTSPSIEQPILNGRLNLFVKNNNSPSRRLAATQQQTMGPRSASTNRSPAKQLAATSELPQNSPIVDSGYGSLDKLRSDAGGGSSAAKISAQQMGRRFHSPVLSKRSTSIKSSNIEYLREADRKMRQQISFTDEEDGGNGGDDDDDEANSDRGSSGFVHMVGANAKASSMKDTAYDRVVKVNKKK